MNNLTSTVTTNTPFIVSLTCGDPDLQTTERAVRQAVQEGADVIALGIPFSDPTAEGPLLQASNLRAREAGITTDDVFQLVRMLRQDIAVPILFLTYANVVFSYGTERFLAACQETGVNGLLFHDLPYEEREEFAPRCHAYGVSLLIVIAPASASRISMVAKEAEGLIYVLVPEERATKQNDLVTSAEELLQLIRTETSVPCMLPYRSSTIGTTADGYFAHPSIVQQLAAYGSAAPEQIGAYVRQAKQALSNR